MTQFHSPRLRSQVVTLVAMALALTSPAAASAAATTCESAFRQELPLYPMPEFPRGADFRNPLAANWLAERHAEAVYAAMETIVRGELPNGMDQKTAALQLQRTVEHWQDQHVGSSRLEVDAVNAMLARSLLIRLARLFAAPARWLSDLHTDRPDVAKSLEITAAVAVLLASGYAAVNGNYGTALGLPAATFGPVGAVLGAGWVTQRSETIAAEFLGEFKRRFTVHLAGKILDLLRDPEKRNPALTAGEIREHGRRLEKYPLLFLFLDVATAILPPKR